MATIAEMNWIAAVDVRDQLKRELALAENAVRDTYRAVQAERGA